jgi:hypothetical protein
MKLSQKGVHMAHHARKGDVKHGTDNNVQRENIQGDNQEPMGDDGNG